MIEQLMSTSSNLGVFRLEVTPECLQNLVKDAVRQTIKEVVKAFGINQVENLITRKEAMEILKVKTQSTMMSWEEKGYLKPRKISGRIYYERTEVIEAVEKFERIDHILDKSPTNGLL